jgi:hypothetical protein
LLHIATILKNHTKNKKKKKQIEGEEGLGRGRGGRGYPSLPVGIILNVKVNPIIFTIFFSASKNQIW